MFRFILPYFEKIRPAHHHIIGASLIIAYWWAIWNILDILFLAHKMTQFEIISICVVGVLSLIGMYLLDFDFSDI